MKRIFCEGMISKCFRDHNLGDTNRFKYNSDHGSLTLWTVKTCPICDREFLVGEPVMIVDAAHTPWNHLIFAKKSAPLPPELAAGLEGFCSECDDKHFSIR